MKKKRKRQGGERHLGFVSNIFDWGMDEGKWVFIGFVGLGIGFAFLVVNPITYKLIKRDYAGV